MTHYTTKITVYNRN